MEPIELPHCTIFDAGSTPYIKKNSITSVYPEYLVLGKDDCIEMQNLETEEALEELE